MRYGSAAATVLVALLTAACSDSSPAPAGEPSPTLSAATAATTATTATTTTTTTAAPTTTSGTATSAAATTQPTTTTTTLPATAEAIAAELTAVERGLRDPALDTVADADAIAALGHRQQLAYRQLARHDELDDAVLALVGTDVVDAVRHNVEARRAVTANEDTEESGSEGGGEGTPEPGALDPTG